MIFRKNNQCKNLIIVNNYFPFLVIVIFVQYFVAFKGFPYVISFSLFSYSETPKFLRVAQLKMVDLSLNPGSFFIFPRVTR